MNSRDFLAEVCQLSIVAVESIHLPPYSPSHHKAGMASLQREQDRQVSGSANCTATNPQSAPAQLTPSPLGSGSENLFPILDFLTEGPGGWVPTSSTLLGRSTARPRGQDCESEAQAEQMQITACQAPTV